MALLKIKDFDPNYRETFGGNEIDDIKGRDVYTQGTEEKIGTIDDILVDEHTGEFRYLLLNLGFGTIGKKVLLPVGRSRMSHSPERVYASLSKEQAERLPELEPERNIDYDYEERVRGVYRADSTASSVTPIAPLETSAPMAASAPIDAATAPSMTGAMATGSTSNPTYNRDTYAYHQEPSLYGMNDRDHQTLKLYEERLTASKRRMKTGEVTVGKHVETETERVSVPIEKERVVIERVTPPDAGKPVAPGAVDFSEGEVAHVEIYEETPDIHKEAFVREEVRVNKVVEHETVQAQDTIRREELDVKTDDIPVVERPARLPNDRV
jgi:uncharacterized protein (TIGR02271 family)